MKFLSIASILGIVTNAQSLSMMSAPNLDELMSMDGTEYDTFQASDSMGLNRKYSVETEDMMDYFLFAGQSNSIGHTTSKRIHWLRRDILAQSYASFSIAEIIGTSNAK